MKIWIDADACPAVIKELLFRASERTGITVTLVANNGMPTPKSALIDSLVVPGGPDVADDKIVELLGAGDLVITADVPLAARVVEHGGTGLNPRGTIYNSETISEALGIRDLLTDLRSAGEKTGGPGALTPKSRQAFANQLDRWLAVAVRQGRRGTPRT